MSKVPIFSRRHYQRIANELSLIRPLDRLSGAFAMWSQITDHFVILFQADNPRFDRERFLTWCYQNGAKSPHV